MSEEIFVMKNITKQFPGVKALDNVTFGVERGKVHALVGENGAGKSTLMKILSGLYPLEEGEIYFHGEKIGHLNPKQVQELGICTIYQELNLCSNLTVGENIFLGKEPVKTFLTIVEEDRIAEASAKYLAMLSSDIDPRMMIDRLSIAEQQIVEIAKALSYESEVIIMDEPTSSLTLRETEKLLEIVKSLRDQGHSIVYISHRLGEVFQVADVVTVLRDGKHVGTDVIGNLDYDKIVQMMVGREIENKYYHTASESSRTIGQEHLLEVDNLSIKGLLQDISFHLRPGEILGFSGIVGAGRTELMEAVFGIREVDSGEIKLKGEKVRIRTPKDAIRFGLGMTSEDRKNKSLFLNFNVRENVTIANLWKLTNTGYISQREERAIVETFIELLNIKPPNTEFPTVTMSGGNQQKVVISKSLSNEPHILIMDEPTRGIDVGAKAEIYKIIKALADEGKGILFVSSELPEILSLCDRILVMNQGAIVGEFTNAEASEEKIMALSI
jgi:ribose transport system ATP-binding protein